MKILAQLALLIITTFSIAESAVAADSQERNLHVSGGISMPSSSTAVHTNAAGLTSAQTAAVFQAGAPEVWSNGTYRFGMQTGGPSFGVAAGLEHRDRSANDPTLVYYGLAVGVPAFSLGIAGITGISNSDGSSFNAGVLFPVGTSAQIGITSRGSNDGVNEWGAGISAGVANGVDLIFDAASDEDLDNIEIKPGLKVGSGGAALSISYGTGPREQFADDFTAGASFILASGSVLEFHYNAGGSLSKYYAGLQLGF